MRTAPPVSVRCTGGRVWQAVQAGLPALAAAALAAWGLGMAERPLWPAALAAGLAALVAWRFAPMRPLALEWNGQRWSVEGTEGPVEVMMDLGPWLLLRQRPHGRPRWLAVSAREAGPAMHGLRAALYAPPPVAP